MKLEEGVDEDLPLSGADSRNARRVLAILLSLSINSKSSTFETSATHEGKVGSLEGPEIAGLLILRTRQLRQDDNGDSIVRWTKVFTSEELMW